MLSRPSTCSPCALDRLATGFLRPEVDEAIWRSPRSTRVLIIGESGGSSEVAEGLPFRPSGQAGAVLTRCIKEAGFERSQFAFANLCMCQPPGNELDGASWEHEAVRHCGATQLDALVARLKPGAILMAGGLPTKHLAGVSGKKQTIRMTHGYAFDTIYNVPGVACFHPAFLSRGAMELVPAMSFAIQRAVDIAKHGLDTYSPSYVEMPSVQDAEEFAERVQADATLNLAVDIETDESASLDEDDLGEDFGRFIKSIQFSLGRREGIFLPWVEPFVEIARRVLAMPNRKIGHNMFRFDAPRLRAAGMTLNGDIDDTLWMWKAFQPDLPGHLQFVSAMCGFPGPAWKHLSGVNAAQYGCADVDALQWIYPVLCAGMKARQCEPAYWRYQKLQDPILVAMTTRGIPVIEGKRLILAQEIVQLKHKLISDIQALVPDALRGCSPKDGYKRAPAVRCPTCGGKKPRKPRKKSDVIIPPCATCGGALRVPATEGLVQREFATPDGPVMRWCSLNDWNPNSSQQVLEYVRYKGHRVPVVRGDDRETSDKKSLHRLARQTGDPLYHSIIDFREMTKMGSAFVDGWASGVDGRVHPQFWVSTAVLQLTSRNPNALQIPTPKGDSVKDVLAARFRDMIEAPEGRRIVEFDMAAFHAQTLAFNAGDATYLWAAKHDIHSFVAAHLLKLPEASEMTRLLQDASSKHRIDPDLIAILERVKKSHKAVRNSQAKPCIAEGQLVLTDKGLVPIEKVEDGHRLWDGVEWVQHGGVICQGEKEVMTYDGLTATPDHEVVLEAGSSCPLRRAASSMARLEQTGLGRTPVRTSHGDFLRTSADQRIHSRLLQVSDVRAGEVDLLGQSKEGQYAGVSVVFSDKVSTSRDSGPTLRRDCCKVSQPQEPNVSSLRCSGDRVPIQESERVCAVGNCEPAAYGLQRDRDRPDRQQRPLRAGESQAGDSQGTDVQYVCKCVDSVSGRAHQTGRIQEPLHSIVDEETCSRQGDDWRADNRDGENCCRETCQTQPENSCSTRRARVYDIVDAGPRRCYTVSGKLVFNCVLGVGFGLGYRKLYEANDEHFASEAEARKVLGLLRGLFPKVFEWQDSIRKEAHLRRMLRNHFGVIRYFWDVMKWNRYKQYWEASGQDSESAIAFLPASDAHCIMAEARLQLDASGWLERAWLCNAIHDSLVFIPRDDDMDEFLPIARDTMQQRFKQMTHPVVAPDGFSVEVECKIGKTMADMQTISIE